MKKPQDSQKPKRLSGAMRDEHLERGAFLIEFAQPDQPMDMFGGQPCPPGLGPPSLLAGNEWQSAVDKYRTMERKGFRVTKDIGCLIPDSQYSTYQQGSTITGHQRTFAFFGKWVPKKGNSRNLHGWPSTIQISHLCHRRSCARPDHLLAEEQWRHLKRNYCGFGGGCDCGSAIKCLQRYQMEDQSDSPQFCETAEEVREVLAGAPKCTIHSRDRHIRRDQKAQQRKKNRESRKRKVELHQHATERKQSRLGGQPIIEDDSESQ